MESLTKEKVNDIIAEIRGAIMSGNCFQDIFIPVSRDDYRIWSDMMEHIGYSFHMVRLDEMHNCLPAKNVLTYYTQGVKVHIFVVDDYKKNFERDSFSGMIMRNTYGPDNIYTEFSVDGVEWHKKVRAEDLFMKLSNDGEKWTQIKL